LPRAIIGATGAALVVLPFAAPPAGATAVVVASTVPVLGALFVAFAALLPLLKGRVKLGPFEFTLRKRPS
jgi:hypothetical protein